LNPFGHKTEPKVLLTYDVMMKCQCPMCPVQVNSACAKPKIVARDEMMKNTPKEQIEGMMPKAEDMPGPYCANGVAVCKDFDFNKMCICSGCKVFKDFNLTKGKPMSHFCKEGKAA
jgi:hypothetical protein